MRSGVDSGQGAPAAPFRTTLAHLAEVEREGLAGALAVGRVSEQSLLQLAAADASHAAAAASAVHKEAVEGPEAGPRLEIRP